MSTKTKLTALQVARYLIRIAAADEDPLTHLRLHKLLYYVQGWSLAMRNKELFSDSIQAWTYGPVVPAVWKRFQHYGSQVILPTDEPSSSSILDKEAKNFIERVWDTYKEFSALKLKEMTHREGPWKNARVGVPPGSSCTNTISPTSMKEYFTKCLNN